MRTQKLLFFVALLCSNLYLFAQDQVETNVIPPSPTASSFQKYIDMPVSLYTGTPSISIPLFELKTGQLSLPISLSYHASGLKVSERASWVGAGWTLNAGGAVSRSTKGLPDEVNETRRKGYFHTGYLFQANGNIDQTKIFDCTVNGATPLSNDEYGPYTRLDSISQGLIDLEPDIFYYSSPGGGFKFTFSQERDPVKFVFDDTKILNHPFSDLNNINPVWKFQSSDGVVYTFSKEEKTTVRTDCGQVLTMYNPSLEIFTNTWYLSSMSLNGDSINFFYEDEQLSYNDFYNESVKVKIVGTNGPSTYNTSCTSYTDVSAKRLSRIETSDGYTVKFNALSNRLDLLGSKSLDEVHLEKDGQLVQKYALNYAYFGSNRKLKLTEVKQISALQNETLPGHKFSYYESGTFPAVNSRSQDFWGYFNGATNLYSLIPPYKNLTHHVNRNSTTIREPNFNSARIGSLSKITYPTGGFTEFEYELHNFYENDFLETVVKVANASGGSLSSPVLSSVEFTLDQTTIATVDYPQGPPDIDNYATLKRWNGSSFVNYTPGVTTGNRVSFQSGTYQLFARNTNGNSTIIRLEYEIPVNKNVIAGGLRIRRIKNTDPALGKIYTKNYSYLLDNGNSSGLHFSPTIFGGNIITHYFGQLGGIDGGSLYCSETGVSTYMKLSSHIQIPLATYSGSHVGYSQVDEIVYLDQQQQQIENGKVRHQFINSNDGYFFTFPFPGSNNNDLSYKNGRPLSKAYFESSNGTLKKISETKYSYSERETGYMSKGIAIKSLVDRFCFNCNETEFASNYYEIKEKWYYLTKEQTINYKNEIATLVSEMYYSYDTIAPLSHTFPQQEWWLDSKNNLQQKIYTRMQGLPALVTAIESKAAGITTQKVLMSYHGRLMASRGVLIDQLTNYVPEFHNSYENNRIIKRIVSPQYIEDQPVSGSQVIQYVWGYNNAYPIAEFINKEQRDVFFTSFEDHLGATPEDQNNQAHTGERYWTGSFNFSANGFTPSNTADLLMSYWFWDQNHWELRETDFNNMITEGTRLDDIRVFPKGSLVKTFTYKNGVGPDSVMDTNNTVQFYQYDIFNRLEYVKDEVGNVLQKYQYSYKQ